MKTYKVFFALIIFSFFSLMGYTQIKVLSNGKVGIGTDNPRYGLLELGKSGANNGLAIYDSLSTTPSFRLYSSGELGYLNFGGNSRKGISISKDGYLALGFYESMYPAMKHHIDVFINSLNPTAALVAYVDFPFDYGDVVSVVSRRKTDMSYVVRSGTMGSNEIVYYVNGGGEVYSKGSLLTASDISFKDNIRSISNGLNVIKKMRGVTYKVKEQSDDFADVNSLNSSSTDTISSQSPVPGKIIKRIKEEKKRNKAGFIAQELEEVFPEAVYTLPDGKKAIAYSEIIPLLVEAIKEQQNEIDEMKQSELIRTRSAISNEADEPEQPDINSLMDDKLKAKLYSNIPNPFKERTIISFFIPETAFSASIHIYNLQGNQIKQLRIDEKGNSSVVINGYELTPGMYMYTLIVDGEEIDTKKMILTE